MLNLFKNFFRKNFPKFFEIIKIIFINENIIQFEGWGLSTTQVPPWKGISKNKTFKEFNNSNSLLLKKIKTKKFLLSQFDDEDNIFKVLDRLRYRHYIVYYTSLLAFNNTRSRNIVECGVCDGLTVFFAINKYSSSSNYKAYLYDSWEVMKDKYLITKEEKKFSGAYNYLNIDNTKRNLNDYKNNLIYNKGYIPDVFKKSKNPKTLSWMHIDLNSSLPTIHSLKYFFPKVERNGVILFDDYGWRGYEDSRRVIEKYLENKKGDFFHLPTGQAFFIKR